MPTYVYYSTKNSVVKVNKDDPEDTETFERLGGTQYIMDPRLDNFPQIETILFNHHTLYSIEEEDCNKQLKQLQKKSSALSFMQKQSSGI